MPIEKKANGNEEVSLRNFFISIKEWRIYFGSKWLVLLLMAIAGGIIGYFYANSKPIYYEASNSFVLDDDRSSKGGMMDLSALGLDIGGGDKGLFTNSKNIIWLYHSKLMLGTTLLSKVEINNKPTLLLDFFIKESKIEKAFKGIVFKVNDSLSGLTREQNAAIQTCIGIISSPKYLNVEEEKQADGVINVKFKSKNEQFSKLFSDVLIKTVNEYYIETRTQKISNNIRVLETKMDSTRKLLGNQSIQVASSFDNVPYANPNRSILRVAPEKERVDVEATKEMYLELAKNLAGRKMILAQETPLIKEIDISSYPLSIIYTSKIVYSFLGTIIGVFITVLLLYIIRLYSKIMSDK